MLVKNIPPVPEGFDPDSVQLGPLPEAAHAVFALSTQSWTLKPATGKNYSNAVRIFCLPLKPWYPASWYDSNGNLLPDVHEYDDSVNKWPEHVGPLDEIEALSGHQRANKKGPHTGYRPCEVMSWNLVAYRIVKRYQS
jgi:hypothetical protein